ncbi:MAG: T9SS type A sorting domain-containing protein [Bacteroidota bacterium]
MKKLLLALLMISSIIIVMQAQTYTSATNGNWTNPTTWNPVGVPVTFTSVTINHNVTLNTDFIYYSGDVVIGNNGTLAEDATQRAFVTDGGTLTINGTMTVHTYALNSGSFENYGTFNVPVLYFGDDAYNEGLIDNVDSLLNEFELENAVGAVINADKLYNDMYLYNVGDINGWDYYNDGDLDNGSGGEIIFINFFNADSAYNYGTIGFNDHTNAGYFENYSNMEGGHDFTNMGDFENYGSFLVINDFMNADTIASDAYFYTEGLVTVGNNFLNADTIEGTASAQFCVEMNSGNSGEMIGDFDFCDNTPPANPPFIDYNTGNIDAGIVYCVTPCQSGIIQASVAVTDVSVYPNPAWNSVHVDIKSEFTFANIFIYNITGNIAAYRSLTGSDIVDLEDLHSGIYLYRIIIDGKGEIAGKLVIE